MLKQFIYELKSEPVVTWVTIIGTALAIFLIMTVVMMQEVKTAPYSPESHRDRMLHWGSMSITHADWGDGTSNGPMSYWAYQNIIEPLESAETSTAYACMTTTHSAALRDHTPIKVDILPTDHRFFDVFDLQFIAGKPYDQAQFESSQALAVLPESTARQLFGSAGEDLIGSEFLIDLAPYRLIGIVKDVSPLADHAYSQLWVPLTATSLLKDTWNDNYMGMLSSTILARDKSDFPAILAELDKIKANINTQMKAGNGYQYVWRNRPYTTEKDAVSKWANVEPDLKQARRSRLMVYLILLIVPAINLSSMTQSRVKRRMAEIAVRRSYGATRSGILGSLIMENLSMTLIAGLIGFGLSVAFALMLAPSLFNQGMSATSAPTTASLPMLLHWSTLGMALLFCFILNLLCTGVPAWRASRASIVNSL
ncbi:MAG: ABC transporter permease [Paramuribaculum sp.]|nr:ABC transporter permease [Paramuribaculum sp.]